MNTPKDFPFPQIPGDLGASGCPHSCPAHLPPALIAPLEVVRCTSLPWARLRGRVQPPLRLHAVRRHPSENPRGAPLRHQRPWRSFGGTGPAGVLYPIDTLAPEHVQSCILRPAPSPAPACTGSKENARCDGAPGPAHRELVRSDPLRVARRLCLVPLIRATPHPVPATDHYAAMPVVRCVLNTATLRTPSNPAREAARRFGWGILASHNAERLRSRAMAACAWGALSPRE